MFGSTRMRPRKVGAGLVVSGLTCALAFAPSAVAASRHSVQVHLRDAQTALRWLSASHSASGGAQLNRQLRVTTSQFGVAETMSVTMAMEASTPDLMQTAADALGLVTRAEARAESVLADVESRVGATAGAEVARADLAITQGQGLALSVLASLSGRPGADSQAIQAEISTIAAQAGALLGNVVDELTVGSGCQADVPQITSAEAASVQESLDGRPASHLGHITDAGGSLLGEVTNSEIANATAQVESTGGCQSDTSTAPPSAGASASAQGNVVTSLGL